MNKIYGWEMSEYLCYGGFKWLKNVNGFDVHSISEKSEVGYFLEIELQYPNELHELHNDYPLALFLVYCYKNTVKELQINMKQKLVM